MQPSPKKIARTEHRDHRHSTRRADHGEFYVVLLDVHDALRRVALAVNLLVFSKFSNFSCHSRSIEKGVRRFRLGFLDFHTSIGRLCSEARRPIPSMHLTANRFGEAPTHYWLPINVPGNEFSS
jgi:hypothetical protein